MNELEFEAIKILKKGEPIPVDIYISLYNLGINPDLLITHFYEEEEQLEPN